MKILKIFLLALLLVPACSNNSANTNASNKGSANGNVKTSPSPAPTLSKEESDKKDDQEKAERAKAINEFLAKNYPGWKLQGVSAEMGDCRDYSDEPCNLHLTKNGKDKIIGVFIKRFKTEKGEEYWTVYEARPIDLAQAKIEEIKQREKESVLENLTTDDIDDSLKQIIYEEMREEYLDLASEQDYEPADPY
jgi:hypothetical protein